LQGCTVSKVRLRVILYKATFVARRPRRAYAACLNGRAAFKLRRELSGCSAL
jgi:hypothetical protein